MHFFFDLFAEFTHRDQVFAFFAIWVANVGAAVTQEVSHLDAGDRDRALERQEQSRAGSFVRFQLKNVFAVEQDFAFGGFVRRVAHDGQTECAFTRAVRPHQCVGFATSDLQVYTTKDFFVANRDVKVFDF